MCPGSPDRGHNACVEGLSVVTEVAGRLRVRLPLSPSLSFSPFLPTCCQDDLLNQKQEEPS